MRINSSDVVMSSQHSFSKTDIENETSFESFIHLDEPVEVEETKNIETVDRSYAQNDDEKTLQEIFKELFNKLSLTQENASMSAEDITKEVDKAIGYSHLSIYNKHEEHESISVNTTASIQTDKGSLDLDLNYSMSRDFVVENRVDIYTLTDPLVVNLDGELPTLSKNKFSFDIDNDGESDQISKLGNNSGFLALDKNSDGSINQGNELFGTTTGDGFSELSIYDKHNNGWIDENDAIFDKLQIWLKNDDTDEGEKELFGLGEVGIGAIFLGNTDSEFTYKTDENQTLGELKKSGFFLNNNLTTGTISQIDLNKTTKNEPSPLTDLLQA